MTDPLLLDRAATCYLRAGQPVEAARCYREAGAHRRAADLFARLGRYRDAAADYAGAGAVDVAAWTLVHHAGDPVAARALLTEPVPGPAQPPARPSDGAPPVEPAASTGHPAALPSPANEPGPRTGRPARLSAALRRRLVLARCDVAEGAPESSALPVLADMAADLARPDALPDVVAEGWAVALAEAMRRYDQAALVFAAAVRGGRYGAAERWARWSQAVLHTELTLPTAPRLPRLLRSPTPAGAPAATDEPRDSSPPAAAEPTETPSGSGAGGAARR